MAALSVCHSFCRNSSTHELKSIRNSSKFLFKVSCQGHEPAETCSKEKQKEKKESKRGFSQVFVRVEKLGKDMKNNLSPQQKGDWKDLMLMSFSFAVYVYMSQKIVCAYFAWMSMPKQSW